MTLLASSSSFAARHGRWRLVWPAILISAWTTGVYAQTFQDARAALAVGDTGFALETLRAIVTTRSSPQDQCLFATVLARSTTSEHAEWKKRDEAKRWFERSLKARQDPVCLLELASLYEKQGIRVDAGRIARRAFELLSQDSSVRTPEAMAEAYYRRALPVADWIRNFEDLVLVNDLPVSTGNCDEQVLFCEAVLSPTDFLSRLERGAPGGNLVGRERDVLRALLDSALSLVPNHQGALRTALREAATREDWERYLTLALRAREADPSAAGGLLAVLSGLVTLERWDPAQAVFDSLMTQLGPDQMARYEGLALVADTSLRERLAGAQHVVYGEAIWGLSDPLYLTNRNERRLAHYARIVLADVVFSDPAAGRAGRDTPQGRLVIRYGMPRRRFAVRADERLKLTEWHREMMDQVLACGTKPTYYLGPRQSEGENICVPALAGGHAFDAGGRWEFWYYDEDGPPLIFERALGYRVARHMFETRSRELDSLLHRNTPSVYTPPYASGSASLLVTAFPRPNGGVIEAWARFVSADSLPAAPPTELGVFVHDAGSGREVGRHVATRPGEARSVLARTVAVPWGTFRITAEAAWADRAMAAQTSRFARVERGESQAVWLSDLLLGDSADAPPRPATRDDVYFFALTDSLVPPQAALAVYWENYGLARAADAVHYRVRLSLTDAQRRPLAARVLRSVGRALGLSRDVQQAIQWEVRREAADVLPDLVIVSLPEHSGDLRITVLVQDLASGKSATTERLVTVTSPP